MVVVVVVVVVAADFAAIFLALTHTFVFFAELLLLAALAVVV